MKQMRGTSLTGSHREPRVAGWGRSGTPGWRVVLSLGLGALILAGCENKHDPGSAESKLPAARVPLATVRRISLMSTDDVAGTVRARLSSVLESKVAGRVKTLLVQPGDRVSQGQLLAELDVLEIGAQLEQARAQRDQFTRDLGRIKTLYEKQAATRQELDAIESRARGAEAAVTQAEVMLGYARITAPFDGVVTGKFAGVGDLAMPGKPLLGVEDPSTVRFEADLPESLRPRVLPGARLAVRMGSGTTSVTGVVSEIAPTADSVTRTFRVKLDLESSADVRAGQFGRVSVPVSERSALVVPMDAVVRRGQMELVFVALDQRASLRLVRTPQNGFNSGGFPAGEVELISGVSEGERVVSAGADLVRDGQPLEEIQ
jgi:RND family efflux transporter MFP subunit